MKSKLMFQDNSRSCGFKMKRNNKNIAINFFRDELLSSKTENHIGEGLLQEQYSNVNFQQNGQLLSQRTLVSSLNSIADSSSFNDLIIDKSAKF